MYYIKRYSSQTTTNNICLRWITNVFILKKKAIVLSPEEAQIMSNYL